MIFDGGLSVDTYRSIRTLVNESGTGKILPSYDDVYKAKAALEPAHCIILDDDAARLDAVRWPAGHSKEEVLLCIPSICHLLSGHFQCL